MLADAARRPPRIRGPNYLFSDGVEKYEGITNSMSERHSVLERRRLLRAGGTMAAAGLTGCLGSESEAPRLEVLHDWTGGSGEAAITALTDQFEAAHPDVDADFRPIAVTGDITYEAVVRNRLDQGDPPSSFAARAGAALGRYEGYLGDAGDEVLQDGELATAHVDAVREHCRYDGRTVAVPVSVRRTNCLFYGVDVVDEAGVDPESLSTPSDLLDALERIAENTDATPMAHGMADPASTLQLIATVLLGQSGSDAYATFVDGEGGEEAIRSALETTERILSKHAPSDADSFGQVGAADEVVRGSAAFLHQGDWAADALRSEGFEFETDWDFVPFPGTSGAYTLLIDAFVSPVDDAGENPSPSPTATWLRHVGGREGQQRFNAVRGATPPRTDVPVDAFEPFATRTVEAFRDADRRPPSIAYGTAVDPDRVSGLKSVVTEHFSGPFDVASTARGMLDAVRA